ncbi:MAG: hypothetical protein M1822_000088 [Bathelium mastoideum]|nr:MAG: hypothetical protein M1822_000088 [Bathelium mastoideum]
MFQASTNISQPRAGSSRIDTGRYTCRIEDAVYTCFPTLDCSALRTQDARSTRGAASAGLCRRQLRGYRRERAHTWQSHEDEGPNERKIRHVYRDAGLAHVPEHVARGVDVCNVLDLSEDGSADDESTETEEWNEDEFLPKRQLGAVEEREQNGEHERIGGYVEASLDDSVMCKCCTWAGNESVKDGGVFLDGLNLRFGGGTAQ